MAIQRSENLLLVDFDFSIYQEFCNVGIEPKVIFTRDYKCFISKVSGDLKKKNIFEFYPYRRAFFQWPERQIYLKNKKYKNIVDEVFKELIKDSLYYRFYIRDKGERVSFLQRWGWVDVHNEIHKAIYYYLDLLENNKINKIIMSKIPHEGTYVVLFYLAHKIGVETVVCCQSLLPNYFWKIKNPTMAHFFDQENLIRSDQKPGINIPEVKRPHYMKQTLTDRRIWKERIVGSLKLVLRTLFLFWIFNKEKYKKTFHKFFISASSLPKTRNPKYTSSLIETKPYVYFPLHLQPEMTTDSLGAEFADQIYAIERLRAILPDDWIICCKENPKQKLFMREDGFFDRLISIPGVRIVDINVDSFDLIKSSQFVATVTGTAGWEALRMNKKVLLYGDAWYKGLYGVYKHECIEDISEMQLDDFDYKKLILSFSELSYYLHEGVVDETYQSIVPNWNEKRNAEAVVQSLIGTDVSHLLQNTTICEIQ